MPGMRHFVFQGPGCIRPSMHPTFTRGLRLFRNLRSLEIVDFVLANFGELRRIILASPQLDTLVLRDGKCALPVRPSLAPSERPQTLVSVPHLRRLELCHLDIGLLAALIDWFVTVHPPCCQHVTDLVITEVAGQGAKLVTRFLQVIGPSLEHISLAGMPGRVCDVVDETTLSLACNPSFVSASEGHADFFGFLKTWSPIVRTVPKTAWGTFQLTFFRMG